MFRLLSILVLISLSVNAQMNTYYQQHVSYQMDIDVDVKKYQYDGKQTIVYTNNSPEVLDRVYFHLYFNAFQPGSMMDQRIQYMENQADGRMVKEVNGNTVSRIKYLKPEDQGFQHINVLKQNGKNLNFTIEGTVMTVELAEPVAANGGKTTFYMEWKAQIPEQIRRSGKQNKEGIELSMTQWYPKMAEYDYEGWHTWEYVQREFQGVFGDFDVKINIDNDFVVAAGGVLENASKHKGYGKEYQAKKGKSVWHYKAHNIHDFAWAADPDYIVDQVEVPYGPQLYFVRQDNDKTAFWKEAYPKAVQFFQIMNEKFGQYLYPTYTFAQGGDGGMEYGMITLIMGNGRGNDKEVKLKGLCGLMFHEAAHSWFQQMIATNESMRAWMDEGFTSFAEAYCMAQIFPNPNLPYFNAETTMGLAQFQNSGREELASHLADHYETSAGYSVAAYVKGSAYLSALSYIVGEDTFWQIMKEYYNVWKLKHPTDTDFLHIAQKVSGMDLKWFHNYFIYTKEPIKYSLEKLNSKGKSVRVKVTNEAIFPMPIDLLVELKNGKKLTYTIPLRQMRGVKSEDTNPIVALPACPWTQKEYEATIPHAESDIQSISIDGTYRLPNVAENTKLTY